MGWPNHPLKSLVYPARLYPSTKRKKFLKLKPPNAVKLEVNSIGLSCLTMSKDLLLKQFLRSKIWL